MAASKRDRIGFVGLGIMGRPMAGHLVDAGYETTVFDLLPDAVGQLESKGAVAGSSPADVAARSDITITMVPDSQHVEAAIAGPGGILEGAAPGSVVIDMSTISPMAGQKLAATLKQQDVEMLDAPVTGGETGAINGSLSILVGGDANVFERCLPVLQVLGGAVTHMGPGGSGHTAKLANQVLGIGCTIGICEGLVLASKAGLDLNKFLAAAMNGASTSWHLEYLGPRILAGDFSPGFMVRHMQKDLRLAQEVGAEVASPLPMVALVSNLYRSLQAQGDEATSQGHHALIQVIEQLAGERARAQDALDGTS